jgi:hypothetical protein
MSKISDMMIQYVLKGNAQGEVKNVDLEFNVPHNGEFIMVKVKCDSLTVQIEKARE